MMGQAKDFWQRLSLRERAIMGTGGGLLVVVLLLFYVWQPLEKERARLRTSLPKLRLEARQIQADAAEVPKLKRAAKPGAMAGGLREAVEQAAAAHGLQVAQANPEGSGKLSIMFAAVPFDAWVKWLAALQSQYAIRLESCRVDALPQTGMVKVQAVLAR